MYRKMEAFKPDTQLGIIPLEGNQFTLHMPACDHGYFDSTQKTSFRFNNSFDYLTTLKLTT